MDETWIHHFTSELSGQQPANPALKAAKNATDGCQKVVILLIFLRTFQSIVDVLRQRATYRFGIVFLVFAHIRICCGPGQSNYVVDRRP